MTHVSHARLSHQTAAGIILCAGSRRRTGSADHCAAGFQGILRTDRKERLSNTPRGIIGLTGLPSSGKGEVTVVLLQLARARGWRVEHLSFSDRIKEEACARGIPAERFDRDLFTQIGIEMREAEGPGVLATRIAGKIGAWPEPKPELFVVEALRHAGEIEVLRKTFGKRFILAAVESEPDEVARRLMARRRPDESPEALESHEKAIQLLERELNGKLSELGPDVGQCISRADARLPNHGTLDDLAGAVEKFFEQAVSQLENLD